MPLPWWVLEETGDNPVRLAALAGLSVSTCAQFAATP